MTDTFLIILISGIFTAIASSLTGSFLALRKMTLLSDALSHVALPGLAFGIIFKFQPLIGGLAFLFLAVIFMWGVEIKTKLSIESITGVVFVFALAAGSLMIEQEELLETFFGSVEKITINQAIAQSIFAIIIIGLIMKYLKPLILFSIAPELNASINISNQKMQFILLTLIALTITIGISFVGILLMSALMIIPAVSARNFAKNYKTFLFLSILFGVISLSGGLIISEYLVKIAPGIAIVFVNTFIFLISLIPASKRH